MRFDLRIPLNKILKDLYFNQELINTGFFITEMVAYKANVAIVGSALIGI